MNQQENDDLGDRGDGDSAEWILRDPMKKKKSVLHTTHPPRSLHA